MGLSLLVIARGTVAVFVLVGLLALGAALISPNVAALISKSGGRHRVGAVLGIQNAVHSLGQAGGSMLGGVLLIWQLNAPYLLTGALLITVAVVIGWNAMFSQRPTAVTA